MIKMKIWKIWERVNETEVMHMNQMNQLYLDIQEAYTDWMNAQNRIHDVLEEAQIDYVIYAMGAAEKRYEMLLKQAKYYNLQVNEMYKSAGWRGGIELVVVKYSHTFVSIPHLYLT